MPALKKFTVVDPKERLNLPLRLSTLTAVEQYRVFYSQNYETPVDRNELIEEVLRTFFDADADFAKFQKRMTPADKAAVDKALGSDAGNFTSRRLPGGISDTLIEEHV
ncbi:hypothetical protein QCE62_09670 [Caballeronia sp. LZ033]|uniref:hypothetical protein n=1 Tax=Caballeronia sp. LZ033 TaxID=3038566 RepID=UPI0028674FF9|nr:hypothetical protein [Caballeronia sp. LZ033]MDR5813853.1 hypothetical protein [Caballeronia sp. LZ033]